MPTCKKCNADKQQDEFQLDKRRGKYYTTCRACRVQAGREHRHANLDAYRERTRLYLQKWRAENPERVAVIHKRWADKNRDHVRAYHREASAKWRKENPGKEWKDTNPEAAKESSRKAAAAWKQRNPTYHNEHYKANKARYVLNRANRRAAQEQATPPWLTAVDKAKIAEYYEIAKAKEMQTGDKFHVDHMIPIFNPEVCGLHVPWNLQVITAKENLSKSWRIVCRC